MAKKKGGSNVSKMSLLVFVCFVRKRTNIRMVIYWSKKCQTKTEKSNRSYISNY